MVGQWMWLAIWRGYLQLWECHKQTCCFWLGFYNRWPCLSFCLGTNLANSFSKRVSKSFPFMIKVQREVGTQFKITSWQTQVRFMVFFFFFWTPLIWPYPKRILSYTVLLLTTWQKPKPSLQPYSQTGSLQILLAISGYPEFLTS